jgi:hypothetical protein
MPSARRGSPPDAPRLTFFVDRGLGKLHVPPVFREAGFDVVLMTELYPDGVDQGVHDDRWIMDVSDRGWVALTKDVRIFRDHAAALRASTLRAFALDNANITGIVMAERFRCNLHRIVQRARKAGPYVDVVHRDRLERRWP